MITMDMIGKVRRMKMRDGVSISEIARKTGLSRNTVKKWLKGMQWDGRPHPQLREPAKVAVSPTT